MIHRKKKKQTAKPQKDPPSLDQVLMKQKNSFKRAIIQINEPKNTSEYGNIWPTFRKLSF